MINNNGRKIERKLTKKSSLVRKKTLENQSFIHLDRDISEMNVQIKQYQTIRKKNLFLENSTPVKNQIKPKNRILRINTCRMKNYDCYSITTSTSDIDKSVKKVTFSTVEIIRVEKYKRYNAINSYSKTAIQKNMEEIKNSANNDESMCFIF